MTFTEKMTILENLKRAEASGKMMVAVWRVEGGRVHLDRTTSNFPVDDLWNAVDLLIRDLEVEHKRNLYVVNSVPRPVPNAAAIVEQDHYA